MSLGAAAYPSQSVEKEETLVPLADDALYQEKGCTPGCLIGISARLGWQHVRRLSLGGGTALPSPPNSNSNTRTC